MRTRLLALTVTSATLVFVACDATPERPGGGPEGLYRLAVARSEGAPSASTEQWPKTIEVKWRDLVELEIVEVGKVEGNMCSGGACWYGNSHVEVDGFPPSLSLIRLDGEAANLALVMNRGPETLVDPRSCNRFAAYSTFIQIRLEHGVAEGEGKGDMECVVKADDGSVAHDYWTEFKFTLSGRRVDDRDA